MNHFDFNDFPIHNSLFPFLNRNYPILQPYWLLVHMTAFLYGADHVNKTGKSFPKISCWIDSILKLIPFLMLILVISTIVKFSIQDVSNFRRQRTLLKLSLKYYDCNFNKINHILICLSNINYCILWHIRCIFSPKMIEIHLEFYEAGLKCS